MKTVQLLLGLLIVLFSAGNAVAQYDDVPPPFAIGIRADPDGAGITAKYFLIPEVSVEAMLNGSGGSYSNNGPSTTFLGLLEYNFLFNDPSWRVFMGGGAHVTSWKEYADERVPRETVYGVDAIIGIEYVFTEVPIGISIDVKPAINFFSGVTSFPDNTFGLAVRYYLGRWRNVTNPNPNEIETGRSH